MRQPLKHPDELTDPDRRNIRYFFTPDGKLGRALQVHDLHAAISKLALNDTVPESIWARFETVRNLFVYSWFVYDFTAPATLYAQTIVEAALRERCQRSGVLAPEYPSLKKWLNIAVAQGWLRNRSFPRTLDLFITSFDPETGFTSRPRYEPEGQDYCELLAESLPITRNELAHGGASLEPQGMAFGSLELCANILNALFPKDEPNDLYSGQSA